MIKHITAFGVASLLAANTAFAEQDWLYSVRPGDNLWNLCVKYTTKADCWLKLGDYNNVDYPRQLPPGLIIRFPISWLKELPKPVTLSYFSGEVTYQNSADEPPAAVNFGLQLPIGAIVTTGVDGIAGLAFGDGTEMQLEPGSSLVLDALSVPGEGSIVDSRTRLQSGAVKTRVPERQPKSRFRISTPAAIAAVRGTEFRVSSLNDANGTPVMIGEVFEGRVAVASANREQDTKEVAEGYGIRAKEGESLQAPEPLPSAPEWASARASQQPPISVSWQPVPGIIHYRMEVSRVDQQGKIGELLSVETLGDVDYHDEQLQYTSGCYQFAVRAQAPSALLGQAAEQTVCIRDQLPTPEIPSSSLNFQPEDSAVTLTWQPVTLATHYVVEVSESASFDTVVSTVQSDTQEFALPITDQIKGGFYYRVKAQTNERVDSEFSTPRRAQSSNEPVRALSLWAIFWVIVVAL